MNLWQRTRLFVARQLLKSAAWPIFPKWLRYSFMDISFNTLVREGYKKNSAVFACVQALAFGFSEPGLALYRDGKQDKKHPLGRLLATPNPDMGLKTLLQFTITYAAIGGNCYWWKSRNAAGQVVEIWPLHDAQMEPVSGGTRLIDHYILHKGDAGDETIPREDVIQFMWAVDPSQPWRGMGSLVPIARETDLDSEMTAYTFSLLKNNAVPPLALIVPPGEILQQFQLDRMGKQWVEKYGGDNRGKPAVLEGGMDVKQLSFDINKLAADAMRNVPESRITAAFRVPAIVAMLLVGLENNGAFSSGYKEALQFFTEYTLVPLWDRLDDTLTAGFAADFDLGDADEIRFETENVIALQNRIKERGEFVDRAVRGGYMLRNEAREQLRLPRVAGGDVFLMPMSTIPETARIEQGKALFAEPERKVSQARRAAALALARVLQSIRKSAEIRMTADVQRFFHDLAATVVERANALSDAGLRSEVLEWKRAGWEAGAYQPLCAGKPWQLPLPGLFDDADWDNLLEVFGFWTYTILEESWETWNMTLDMDVSFNRNDPMVVEIVRTLGTRITQISDATLNGVREILAEGYERGWSIDHIVEGDIEAGVPGLRETVSGLTYRGPSGALIHITPEQRARMIARTELGTAQNTATAQRYSAGGVERVLVLDNGFDNSHEFCRAINGKVVPLAWAKEHPLCHPNCVRAYAPEFEAPVDAGAIAAAEAAGTCPFG